jgi:hypothetical protein
MGEPVKVINFANRKPVLKVIGKTIRKAAMCGLMATKPNSKISFLRIKL